jgi:hypothetical protein
LGVAVCGLLVCAEGAAAAPVAPTWSAAVSLIRCASVGLPEAVFPAADPFHAGGPGAILWSGDPADCSPASTLGPSVGIAAFSGDDLLGPPAALPVLRPPGLTSLSAVTATGDGRIVLVGGLEGASGSRGGVSEGPAGGPFTPAVGLGGPSTPVAVTSSYRGDVGIASVDAEGEVELRIEQHTAPVIGPPVVLTSRGAAVSAISVNLDYRGDAIVAWAANGGIFDRVRESSGILEPTQRVGSSPAGPRLEALISDDNRGIVAWETDESTGGTTTTSTYLDVSQTGPHFTTPHLLERFTDPAGLVPPASGLQLVRLAYEGVMVVWTGLSEGHLVVRAAPVSLTSLRPATTVSDPGEDAMLTDVATGPRDEALVLWTTGPRLAGQAGAGEQEILTARGTIDPTTGVAKFDLPQLVAGPGLVATPRVAIDPVSDVAVAVWRNRSRNPGVDFAVRGMTLPDPTVPARREAPSAGPSDGAPGLPVILLTLVGLGLVLLALGYRARSRAIRRGGPRRTAGRGADTTRPGRRPARGA